MPIDRNGAYIRVGDVKEAGVDYFALTLHYHIIQGLRPAAAKKRLMSDYGMSDFESKFLVEKTLLFIKDVLEIDIDAVHSAQLDTATLCGQLINTVIQRLNEISQVKRYENIVIGEHVFHADARTREVLLGYISSEFRPDYWTTADNVNLPLALDELKNIMNAIVARDDTIHVDFNAIKTRARVAAENRDYDALIGIQDELNSL